MARRSRSAGKDKPANDARGAADGVDRKSLGKYLIQKRIGSGGMGSVYQALDTDLNRTVALKVLPKEKATNQLLVKRFKAEAQSAAQLTHDNIVTIYEAGQLDGLLYIALEYVEGTDVQRLLDRRGQLPVRRTIEIVKQVARALQHAHKQGIVHRDIKPSNLLIRRDGSVKLTDLGLARSIDDTTETSITRAGTTVGTVDYMAPEQARDSRSADIRSDIYSLGCTWYHMLVGVAPFESGSLTNKLAAHASSPPPDPRSDREDIPEGVVAILHRMMAKSPEDRYQTPTKLLRDLENANVARKAISDDALAALADGDEPEPRRKPSAASTATNVSNRTTTPPARTLPPPSPPRTLPPPGAPLPPRTPSSEHTLPPPRTLPPPGKPLPPRTPSPERALPPRGGRGSERQENHKQPSQGSVAEPEREGGNFTRMHGVVAAVVGAGILFLLWWISSQFSTDQDRPPTQHQPDAVETGETPQQQQPTGRDSVVSTPGESPGAARPKGKPKPPAKASPGRNSFARRGEDEQIPDWVRATVAAGSDITSPTGAELPTLAVETGEDGADDLERTLKELPQSGGVVRLSGTGPFLLPPIQLTDRGQIVIVGSEGNRPLIVFEGNPVDNADCLLGVSNGSLILLDLDLAVTAGRLPQQGELALVHVKSGDLVVRNCSVKLSGDRDGRTTAFRLSGSQPRPGRTPSQQSRVLLERCFVRGSSLSVVDVDQTAVDLFAGNCLFASGDAPLVRLTNSSKPAPTGGPPARVLRFLSCTACTRRTAFELAPGADADNPPATEVVFFNSLFGAEYGRTDTVLVSLHDWPLSGEPAPNRPPLKNLRWTVRTSLVLGWGNLVRTGKGETLNVWDGADWQQLWQDGVEHAQFQEGPWPEEPIPSFERLTPQQLDASVVEVTGVKASDGGHPGCNVAAVCAPPSAASGTSSSPEAMPGREAPKPNRKPAAKRKKGATVPNF